MNYPEDLKAMDTPTLLGMLPELREEVEALDELWGLEGAEWGDRLSMAADELAFLEAELRRRGAVA